MVCSMAPLRCPETCLVDTKGLHLVVNVVPNFLKLVFQVTDHILGPPHGFPKSSLRLLNVSFSCSKRISAGSLFCSRKGRLSRRDRRQRQSCIMGSLAWCAAWSIAKECCVFWMELSRDSARRCRPSTRREESATFCSKAPVKLPYLPSCSP